MSYGGESPAKKLARFYAWQMASARNPVARSSTRIIVLTGPHAADVRLVRGFGRRDFSRVIAVDLDPECVKAGQRVEPRAQHVLGDALSVCRGLRSSVDIMFLDFCWQLNGQNVGYLARCASAVRDRGTVVAAFSYGREPPAVQVENAARCGGFFSDDGRGLLSELATPDRRRAAAAAAYASSEFARRGKQFDCQVTFSYTSRTDQKPGTPMLYMVGEVRRGSKRSGVWQFPNYNHAKIESGYAQASKRVRQLAEFLAHTHGSGVAADVLNLSDAQVRAWLAVATREGRAPSMPPAPKFEEQVDVRLLKGWADGAAGSGASLTEHERALLVQVRKAAASSGSTGRCP